MAVTLRGGRFPGKADHDASMKAADFAQNISHPQFAIARVEPSDGRQRRILEGVTPGRISPERKDRINKFGWILKYFGMVRRHPAKSLLWHRRVSWERAKHRFRVGEIMTLEIERYVDKCDHHWHFYQRPDNSRECGSRVEAKH